MPRSTSPEPSSSRRLLRNRLHLRFRRRRGWKRFPSTLPPLKLHSVRAPRCSAQRSPACPAVTPYGVCFGIGRRGRERERRPSKHSTRGRNWRRYSGSWKFRNVFLSTIRLCSEGKMIPDPSPRRQPWKAAKLRQRRTLTHVVLIHNRAQPNIARLGRHDVTDILGPDRTIRGQGHKRTP